MIIFLITAKNNSYIAKFANVLFKGNYSFSPRYSVATLKNLLKIVFVNSKSLL